jgi:hypothetical protein
MVILSSLLVTCDGEPLSVTCTVKLNVPAGPFGVPVMAPLFAFSANPEGSEPEVTDHEYGGVPPEAATEAE